MVTRMEKLFFVVIICMVAVTAIFFWGDAKQLFGSKEVSSLKNSDNKKGSKKDKGEDVQFASLTTSEISILQKWDLPQELTEISAISYLDKQRLACIQDEEGSIYIYNINTGSIEKKIPFGGPGDYEGMTLVNGVAYVVNSSGVIFEIDNLQSRKPTVKEYSTILNAKNDVEGIGWDKNRGKLLVTVKKDNANESKGIYAFDPTTKQMSKEPAITIDLNSKMFALGGKKKKGDFSHLLFLYIEYWGISMC